MSISQSKFRRCFSDNFYAPVWHLRGPGSSTGRTTGCASREQPRGRHPKTWLGLSSGTEQIWKALGKGKRKQSLVFPCPGISSESAHDSCRCNQQWKGNRYARAVEADSHCYNKASSYFMGMTMLVAPAKYCARSIATVPCSAILARSSA